MDEWLTRQSAAIEKLYQPSWHYADVGACRGELLAFLDTIMEKGYAFEADPNNCAILQDRFGNSEITIIPGAVSKLDGAVSFYTVDPHLDFCSFGGNLLGHDVNFKELTDYITVPSVTLDTYFKDKQIDFIKLDVEGAEWDVFRGATNLLKDKDILWQVEFHYDNDWEQRSMLYDLDYNIFDLDYKKLSKSDSRPYQAFLSKKEELL